MLIVSVANWVGWEIKKMYSMRQNAKALIFHYTWFMPHLVATYSLLPIGWRRRIYFKSMSWQSEVIPLCKISKSTHFVNQICENCGIWAPAAFSTVRNKQHGGKKKKPSWTNLADSWCPQVLKYEAKACHRRSHISFHLSVHRLSYRTGQDTANCDTCRNSACIIYRWALFTASVSLMLH